MNEKIVVIYRIKNEERWIEKSIESIYDICSEIVILDDGSTDNTLDICKGFDKVVDIHHQENMALDEARDRNHLLNMAYRRNPDIVLSLDGDEVVMPNAKEILQEELNVVYPNESVFEFQFLTLWDKPSQIRIDGISGNWWKKVLFRLKDQPNDLRIDETPYNGNLHCGSIPTNTVGIDNPVRSNVKILHCASLDESIRKKKYGWYTEIDPNNQMTDNYIHMIEGKGRLSGSKGIEIQELPSELLINVN